MIDASPLRRAAVLRGRQRPGPRVPMAAGSLLLCCALLLPVASARASGAGERAPLFTAPDLSGGGAVSLAGFRGEVIYLDFWASWCGPCQTSLPLLDALAGEYAARGFRVVGVNVDRDPEKARRFLAKRPVGYPSAVDPEGRIPETFGVATMPTAFLIDREGVIRYVHRGFRRGDEHELRERIEALLAEAR